jgi:hypothetical protein
MNLIPNRIHFIFGLDPDFGGKPFSYIHYLAIRSAAVVNQPTEIVFHYEREPEGMWWDAAKSYLILNKVISPTEFLGHTIRHFAHRSDILRLQILSAEGGIYLDIDTFSVRPFGSLRQFETVLGVEPNVGLCNAVILAAPGAEFINHWLEEYKSFDPQRWNYHSVQLPYALSLQLPDVVHVESEYSFFFPSYDDPMYLWLWRTRVGIGERINGLRRILKNISYYNRQGGATRIAPYFRHMAATRNWYYQQLTRSYCLHLWESLWWDPYLERLSPEWIHNGEGLFARLVAEVIPDYKSI